MKRFYDGVRPHAQPDSTSLVDSRGGLTPYTEWVWIRREVLAAILTHARRESPRECCGLLIGTEREITEAVPTTNTAAEPWRRYEVSPFEHFAQVKRCRALTARGGTNVNVVGAYHSHPRSAPTPSPSDREEAFEQFLFLIAGPAKGPSEFEVCAYRWRAGKFENVQLIPVPTGGET